MIFSGDGNSRGSQNLKGGIADVAFKDQCVMFFLYVFFPVPISVLISVIAKIAEAFRPSVLQLFLKGNQLLE